MRHKVVDTNKTYNVEGIGDVTIVKCLFVDTQADEKNVEQAKKFAEEYAKEHGLKILTSRTTISNWFEKKIGHMFNLIEA